MKYAPSGNGSFRCNQPDAACMVGHCTVAHFMAVITMQL
nr:MAG TPA: hypothetical protein [Caudoviricetes sp.]